MVAIREILMKTRENRAKKKNRGKIGACGGPWDPISPLHEYPLGAPPPPRGVPHSMCRIRGPGVGAEEQYLTVPQS